MTRKSTPETPDRDDQLADQLAADRIDGPPEPENDDEDQDVIEARIIEPDAPQPTTVATTGQGSGELERYVATNHPAVRFMEDYLAERSTEATEADIAVAEIIGQVLSAESVDEVLADTTSLDMRELMGRPLTIHGWKGHKSAYERVVSWFAYCDVELMDTKERRGATTGAQTVLAQLVRVTMLDGFPLRCTIVKATKKPTAKGYWPYRLAVVKLDHNTVAE